MLKEIFEQPRAATDTIRGRISNKNDDVTLPDLELDRDPSTAGIHTLDEVEPDMRGPAHMIGKVTEVVRPLLADGKFVIMLGGEHSLTCGAVAAYKAKYEHTLWRELGEKARSGGRLRSNKDAGFFS